MNIRSEFNFDNPKYAPLREPSRRVMQSMRTAMAYLDSVKEYVLLEMGLPFTSLAIHEQAHEYGDMWDEFTDIMHQRHLMMEIPPTPELERRVENMDDAFEIIVERINEIENALVEFIRVCDEMMIYPLARQAETIQIENSEDLERWLIAGTMWENRHSDTSFDSWMMRLLGNCIAEGDD